MTDVVVVGCGVIGASVAWRLAQRGMSVTCFDPEPGDGATFAAAGMLAPVTEATFGEHALTTLNVASARAWPDFAAELAAAARTDVGFRRTGTLTVAYDTGDRQQLHRLLQARHSVGLATDEITIEEARRMEPLLGPRIAGATWTPDDHQVDPRRVHAALLAVLAAHDVVVARSRVVALAQDRSDGPVVGVVDEDGSTHRAGVVVLAAGWASRELGGADVATRPVKGEVVRLDASDQPGFELGHVIRGLVQARDVYLVPREDGEVVVGATSTEQPDDRAVTVGGMFALLRDARAVVPGVDELALAQMTARARPGTPDNVPLIGPAARPGLVLATGHYRNGILLAPLTASAVADYVAHGTLPAPADLAHPQRRTANPIGDHS